MDYHGLVKRLQLPDGYTAPGELSYHDIRAHAISRADLDEDVRGINASLDIIRRTRGGGWPTGPVTADYIFLDPPYRMEKIYQQTLQQLSQSRLLRLETIVITEHEKRFDPGDGFPLLSRYRKLVQGDAALSFYRVSE